MVFPLGRKPWCEYSWLSREISRFQSWLYSLLFGNHSPWFFTLIFTPSNSCCCCSVTESWLILCDAVDCSTLPCPLPSPRVCSNPCPLSWWCQPTILSSVIPFSFCPQSFPASGSFPVNQLFASSGQSIGASASVLPMNIRGWFPLGLTGLISLQFRELSRIFSRATVHNFFKKGFCPVLTNMLVSLLVTPSSVFKLILSSEFQTCVSSCQLNVSCTSDPISENEFILLPWIHFSQIISPFAWVASSVQSTARARSMSHLSSFCLVFMDPHSVIQMLIFLYWAYLEFVPVLSFVSRPWTPCLAYCCFLLTEYLSSTLLGKPPLLLGRVSDAWVCS